MLKIANDLLLEFLEHFTDHYGQRSKSSNVHNLCHLVEDMRTHGSLQNISSYEFENKLQQIKSLLRYGHNPLQQAANRILELDGLGQVDV